jgi:hypothetical protein
VIITVTDSSSNSSMCSVMFTVVDRTPPTILSLPSSFGLSAGADGKAAVPNILESVVASDSCTPANLLVKSQISPDGNPVGLGTHSIQVIVSDLAGNSATGTVSFTVSDTTAPTIQALSVSPGLLSPPNHQLVPVTVSALVTDNSDPAPVTKIVSITCNDVTAPGDIQITGNLTAILAASKSSSGGTRIYTINIQAKDASGNTSTGAVTVSVPKSNSNGNGNGNNK